MFAVAPSSAAERILVLPGHRLELAEATCLVLMVGQKYHTVSVGLSPRGTHKTWLK